MLPSPDVAEIERVIGYTFADKELLTVCFTHSSYANAHGVLSNERLEFLGDAVLGFLVAKLLFLHGGENEGKMTQTRQRLVSEAPLKECIERAGLDKFLLFGGGAKPGAKAISSLFESLVAGIYLDGGMDIARAFIEKHILSSLQGSYIAFGDSKTELQELVQKKSGSVLSYELLGESGPDHDKTFTSQVSLNGRPIGSGSGRTKKEAEQAAARAALKELHK